MTEKKKKYSEAELAARNRYNAKTYDQLSFRVPKGRGEELKAEAEKRGMSFNAFVIQAIERFLKEE